MKNKKFNLFLVISFLAINILVANSNNSPFELGSVHREFDDEEGFGLPESLAKKVRSGLSSEKALEIAATIAAFAENSQVSASVPMVPQYLSLMPQNLTIPPMLPPLSGQSYQVLGQPYQNTVLLKNKKVCPTCGKVFPSASKVERHQTVHTNERPFACKQCDKRYTQKGTLVIHVLKRHPGTDKASIS